MNNLLQTLRNLGPARLASMGAVVIGLLAFFIFIITRLSSPSYTLLYGDLDLVESSEIVTRLDSLDVPYQLRANGAQILVPGDEVTRVRMTLAAEGLPSGGTIGYEIFDESEGLGNSSFQQQINRVRALEGELSRTISSIGNVRSARVHLVLPQRELFSRDKQEPSASIALSMKGAGHLDKTQVAAVQHLVASAVPSLKPEQVSIIDDQGTLLAKGFSDANGDVLLASDAAERTREYENRMSRQIEELLEKTVGPGRVRARVTAELDFDRVTTNSETFDPDSQVVRSTQLVEEEIDNVDREADQSVTVQGNIPEAVGEPIDGEGQQGSGSFNKESRVEETVNYEISRVVKQQVRETGVVRRLSVAVLVDGKYQQSATAQAEGSGAENQENTEQQVYEPRSEQELEQIESLVKSAIGFDEERGDVVRVVNMRFNDPLLMTEEEPEEIFMGLNQEALTDMIELIVIAIVGILALLLVVRPMVSRLFESIPSGGPALEGAGGDAAMLSQGGAPSSAPALTGPKGAQGGDGQALQASGDVDMLEEQGASEIEEMINVRQIEGRIKASSIKKVGEIIEKHPDQAATVVRNWMYTESEG